MLQNSRTTLAIMAPKDDAGNGAAPETKLMLHLSYVSNVSSW